MAQTNKSGFTNQTIERMLFDSAVVYKDLEYNEATKKFEGVLLGATQGGVEANIEQTYRQVEIDGTSHMDVVGKDVLEKGSASVKGTLVELTSDNIRLGMNGTKTVSEDYPGYEVISTKRYLNADDYLPNVGVVGTLSNGKDVILMLDNALVVSSFSIKTEDGKEAGVEIELRASATPEQLKNNEFPYRVLYPTDEAPIGGEAQM